RSYDRVRAGAHLGPARRTASAELGADAHDGHAAPPARGSDRRHVGSDARPGAPRGGPDRRDAVGRHRHQLSRRRNPTGLSRRAPPSSHRLVFSLARKDNARGRVEFMKFSLFFEMQIADPTAAKEAQTFHDCVEQAVLADELGYHCVWEVEHHGLYEYSHSSAPEVFLSFVAAKTRRIRLGHGVTLLPFRYN